MTPEEHQLVNDLFDRLAKLESAPRDADAERLIDDGARRAPHALYALVQTALVQDEALKRANARIEELQAQQSPQQQPQGSASFLDSVRETVFGQHGSRSSVPTVRPSNIEAPPAGAQRSQSPQSYPGPAPGVPTSYPVGPAVGSGGSFLGTAASTAAGVVGGALLLNGIRSMFGHGSGLGSLNQGTFGAMGGQNSPWSSGTGGNDPARALGIDQVGTGAVDAADQSTTDDSGSSNNADDGNVEDPDSNDAEDSDSNDSGDNGDGADYGDGGDDGGDAGDSYDV